jgi:hypothetical protein
MPKLISIFLLLSYFNVAFGVGLDIHYCGNKIAEVRLVGLGRVHCHCPKKANCKDCCNEKIKLCQIDSQKVQPAVAFHTPIVIIKSRTFTSDLIYESNPYGLKEWNTFRYCHPKAKWRPLAPLYVLNEVYRL